MSANCCHHCDERNNIDPSQNGAIRRVLWAALAINAAMFAVEIGAGLAAGSASLQADALDFFGDTANYAISLFVAGMALRYRAMAALAKGVTMGLFGLWVLSITVWLCDEVASRQQLPSRIRVFIDFMIAAIRALDLECGTTLPIGAQAATP